MRVKSIPDKTNNPKEDFNKAREAHSREEPESSAWKGTKAYYDDTFICTYTQEADIAKVSQSIPYTNNDTITSMFVSISSSLQC